MTVLEDEELTGEPLGGFCEVHRHLNLLWNLRKVSFFAYLVWMREKLLLTARSMVKMKRNIETALTSGKLEKWVGLALVTRVTQTNTRIKRPPLLCL